MNEHEKSHLVNIFFCTDNATQFRDVFKLCEKMIPLETLKAVLLTRLDEVSKGEVQGTTLSSVYCKSMSFHEIIPEDIQSEITSYVSHPKMFQILPCVSKQFSSLFSKYTNLLNEVPILRTSHPHPKKKKEKKLFPSTSPLSSTN